MTWVSYAQNYEDVVLARVLADVREGFWIDVGAQDPRMDSVTCAFAGRGWRGINLEPVPQWLRRLQESRPRDVNLGVAAGAREGTLRFHEVEDSGLSTSSEEFAARHRAAGHVVHSREVPVRTLAGICAEHVRGPVHFLKVDAEGAEAEVLAGMDFAAVRPWVVLVESTEPNSRVSTHAAWESSLLAQGYAYAYGDGINRYYLAREQAALAPRFGPPTVFDDFVRREQVDAVAEVEARLADVDALSYRRAGELEALAARVAEKDDALADWQSRWGREAEAAETLRGELGHAMARESLLREAHDAAFAREAATQIELDRMHREAAVLQAALSAADGRERTLLARVEALDADNQRVYVAAEALRIDAEHRRAEAETLRADAQAWASQCRRLGAELAAIRTQLAATERRALELAQRIPDLESQLRGAAAAHAAAHAELLRHVALIDAAHAERAVLLASRSWRITAPLRAANALAASWRTRAAGAAHALARQPLARGAAAWTLRPFPRVAGRIRRRLFGAAPDPAPTPTPAPTLALSDDAERILAQAPVTLPGRD